MVKLQAKGERYGAIGGDDGDACSPPAAPSIVLCMSSSATAFGDLRLARRDVRALQRRWAERLPSWPGWAGSRLEFPL